MDRQMSARLLEGRVALVTGGSRGIGAAICRCLAEHGASVAINYHNRHDDAAAVAGAITTSGGHAILAPADVTQEAAVRAVVTQVHDELGPINILVNNAWPGWRGGLIDEVAWDTYHWYTEQIVHAAYNTVRSVVPSMKERRWGRIVNIGTTSMYELNTHHTAYIAAKGALLAFTRGLARDLGPANILVNMVTPGLVYSGEGRPPPDWGQPHAGRTALGHNPTTRDVAGAVIFLASPLADAITGVQLPVCCGLVMQVG
jgi:3-oxoacyl-[acyl-carrier protein] reductase